MGTNTRIHTNTEHKYKKSHHSSEAGTNTGTNGLRQLESVVVGEDRTVDQTPGQNYHDDDDDNNGGDDDYDNEDNAWQW